jgi:hypothetical protein
MGVLWTFWCSDFVKITCTSPFLLINESRCLLLTASVFAPTYAFPYLSCLSIRHPWRIFSFSRQTLLLATYNYLFKW